MRILDKQPVASKSINKVYATFDSDENMAEFLKTVKKFYFLKFKRKPYEILFKKINSNNQPYYVKKEEDEEGLAVKSFNKYKVYLIKEKNNNIYITSYCYSNESQNDIKNILTYPNNPENQKEIKLENYDGTFSELSFDYFWYYSNNENEEKIIKEPPCLYKNINFGKIIYLECAYEEK